MKPEGSFIAVRVIAQHCPELLRGTRRASNPLSELAQLGTALHETLVGEFGSLCAGAKVEVTVGEPAELQPNAGNERPAEPTLNSTIALGPREAMMIASLPCRAVLSLVDLALGGSGQDCAMPSGKLPLSAQLMFGRVEKMLVSALSQALGLAGPDAVKLKSAGAAPEANAPFAGCKRTVLPLQVKVADADPWELLFAFPGSSVATVFAGRTQSGSASPSAPRQMALNPLSAPLGAVPLTLKAVLVDMPVPVSVLSGLQPGMVLPISVARSVPLMAGDQVVAHGSVGALDDHAALQLTRITSIKEK